MGKAVELAKEAVQNGNCVVIDLSHESHIEAESKLLDDFAPTGKGMLKWLFDNYFPLFEEVIKSGPLAKVDQQLETAGKKTLSWNSY